MFREELKAYKAAVVEFEFEFKPIFSAYEIYDEFSLEDKEIAELWSKDWVAKHGDRNHEPILAKMLSARGAELAAIRFYKMLGFVVNDISIQQINGYNNNWHTHDLSLDNNVNIDVKNSRVGAYNSSCYSEHYVPKNKIDRHGNEIVIAGVLSPYADYNPRIRNIEPKYAKNTTITFLGEMVLSKIQKLTKEFGADNLLELTLSRDSDSGYIAPWLFDFPEKFYINNFNNKNIDNFGKTNIDLFNRYCDIIGLNIFPALIGSNTQLENELVECADEWSKKLYRRLVKASANKITLPDLFLIILTEFLYSVTHLSSKSYSPEKYKNLLYATKDYIHPLGIYDPLNLIDNLINNLHKLWTRNPSIEYSQYNGFKLTGPGCLDGKLSSDKPNEKLIAYCGGCGYSPLIKGISKTCGYCNYLICQECNSCKAECKRIEIEKDYVNSKVTVDHSFLEDDIKIVEDRPFRYRGEKIHKKIPTIERFELVENKNYFNYCPMETYASITTSEYIEISHGLSKNKKTLGYRFKFRLDIDTAKYLGLK